MVYVLLLLSPVALLLRVVFAVRAWGYAVNQTIAKKGEKRKAVVSRGAERKRKSRRRSDKKTPEFGASAVRVLESFIKPFAETPATFV